MLIVTYGTVAVAALERAGIPGEKLPWEDVLHDGPVPAAPDLTTLSTVRSRFIADCGWGTFGEVREDFRRRDTRLQRTHDEDEVVLWFEHDLWPHPLGTDRPRSTKCSSHTSASASERRGRDR